MNMKQCPQGHMYDLDVNQTCPICAGGASSVSFNANAGGFVAENIGATMPLNQAQTGGFAAQAIGATMPLDSAPDFKPEDTGRTTALDQFGDDESGEGARPVCGWLVCIEGAKKGRSYEIYPGYTYVGRDDENDIVLDFDDSISSKAVAISYDPEENEFGIGIEKSKNIIKLNNKALHSQSDLADGSVLKLGSSKFIFRALCNGDFKWDFN